MTFEEWTEELSKRDDNYFSLDDMKSCKKHFPNYCDCLVYSYMKKSWEEARKGYVRLSDVVDLVSGSDGDDMLDLIEEIKKLGDK